MYQQHTGNSGSKAADANRLTESGFEALREAVGLARDEGITNAERLKIRLLESGHASSSVDQAIAAWTTYERAKRTSS